ncbi:MAG: hypothetical protein JWN80_1073 [Microbacteriaceae bacterium]|nr:hypothetical protein [Microbacteriaceae bacterium]
MAAISRSRRAAAGIALIVAGALFVLAVLLPLAGIALPWLFLLAYAAMAVALVILALGAVNNTVAKIALFAGAAGWLLLALGGLGLGLPGGLITFGAILAALGGLVGAIVLYVGKEIGNTAALVFVVAAILAVLFLLNLLGVFALGAVSAVVTVLLGIALIVAGVLFRRTDRSRR